MDNDLPFIDEHHVLVAATAPAVWRSLSVQITRPRLAGAEAFAYLVGAEPRRASGRLFDEGATLPGFEVLEAVPERRVRLAGCHRFSRYALILTLVAQDDGTVLSARTHAEFPGLHGRVYQGLVIGSGVHRIVVRRLLRAVRRRAERQGDN